MAPKRKIKSSGESRPYFADLVQLVFRDHVFRGLKTKRWTKTECVQVTAAGISPHVRSCQSTQFLSCADLTFPPVGFSCRSNDLDRPASVSISRTFPTTTISIDQQASRFQLLPHTVVYAKRFFDRPTRVSIFRLSAVPHSDLDRPTRVSISFQEYADEESIHGGFSSFSWRT